MMKASAAEARKDNILAKLEMETKKINVSQKWRVIKGNFLLLFSANQHGRKDHLGILNDMTIFIPQSAIQVSTRN